MKAYKKLQKASIDFTLKCIRIIDFLQKENIDVIKLKKWLLLLAFFYQKVLACLQLLLLKKSSCLPPTPGLIPWRMGEEEGGGGGCGGGPRPDNSLGTLPIPDGEGVQKLAGIFSFQRARSWSINAWTCTVLQSKKDKDRRKGKGHRCCFGGQNLFNSLPH